MDWAFLTRSIAEAPLLFLLLLVSTSFLFFSLNKNSPGITHLNEWDIIQIRRFHLTLSLLFLTTIIYWFIDSNVEALPDPVIPYLFFVIIISLLFTLRVAIATSALSVFLIEYFLYKPRYDLNPLDHPVDFWFTIGGICLSIVFGYLIRKYQDTLIKEKQELKSLIKAREEFESITAHDLKTPLTTIKLYLQSLSKGRDKNLDVALTESINIIDREADKLTEMIDRLLDFSKLEKGKLVLNLKIINLIPICKKQIDSLKKLYPEHKFKFVTKLRKAPIIADEFSLNRILANLLTNAGKYSPPKTIIVVEIKKVKNRFLVLIKDQGKGIAKEHLNKLFDPFYQADSNHPGLGLGLHITKQLLEMQKGSVGVKSSLGKGSVFYFSLPESKTSV